MGASDRKSLDARGELAGPKDTHLDPSDFTPDAATILRDADPERRAEKLRRALGPESELALDRTLHELGELRGETDLVHQRQRLDAIVATIRGSEVDLRDVFPDFDAIAREADPARRAERLLDSADRSAAARRPAPGGRPSPERAPAPRRLSTGAMVVLAAIAVSGPALLVYLFGVRPTDDPRGDARPRPSAVASTEAAVLPVTSASATNPPEPSSAATPSPSAATPITSATVTPSAVLPHKPRPPKVPPPAPTGERPIYD